MSFAGKTLLVTGAASGMGFLCALRFATEGHGQVMMADIDAEKLNTACEKIRQAGGKAACIACDVCNYEQVCCARDATVEVFGSIDVLISIAGGSSVRIWGVADELEFPDIPIEVYDWGIDVNLKGPFYCAHAVMKQMRKQMSGVIINVGSIAGEEGEARNIDYSASKSGIMYGFTKSLALYGASCNVRCVCVSPGPVLTRPKMAEMKTLIGRAAEPDEIVDMILYLASEKGAFITGENILMDGGRNLMRNKE